MTFARRYNLALVEQQEQVYAGAADRLNVTRRQLMSRVKDALDDAAPEVAESAVGRLIQAGVLAAGIDGGSCR